MTQPILTVRGLCKRFPVGGDRFVNAVNRVDLSIAPGETLGMVGESGSGKSTLGRIILRLCEPTQGSIRFDGQDITRLPKGRVRPLRRDMQMVFQDPWSALNPRMRIRDLIGEPLKLHMRLSRSERDDRIEALARRVSLSSACLNRTPSNLSGGQLQRVCIARAIATDPKLIVLDEPTSSLDLSVRAGIVELLNEICRQSRAALLYLGEVVEQGRAEALFGSPAHPYTQALLSAHLPTDPTVKVSRHVLEGEVPSPIALPPGCKFHTRCPVAIDRCRSIVPEVHRVSTGQDARCLRIPDGGNIYHRKQTA